MLYVYVLILQVFVSIKGIYYQVELMGETITWVVPHKYGYDVSRLAPPPLLPCQVGLVVSVSTSHTEDLWFAPRPGHTKDHHENGTNCFPAWHAMR